MGKLREKKQKIREKSAKKSLCRKTQKNVLQQICATKASEIDAERKRILTMKKPRISASAFMEPLNNETAADLVVT